MPDVTRISNTLLLTSHARLRLGAAWLALVLCATTSAYARQDAVGTQGPDRAEPNQRELDEEGLEEFKEELDEYVEMRRKLRDKLPNLPTKATPVEVNAHEVALEKFIATLRARAAEGDLFVSEVRPLIRRLCHATLSTPDGRALLAEIKDESEQRRIVAKVNGRYPDAIPLSAVPYELLKVLPPLPDELEYRFLGRDLILLDTDARIIADVLRNALPR